MIKEFLSKSANTFSYFIVITCISCLLIFYSCKQKKNENSVWISYTEENSELYGFTDEKGNVMIPPRFTGFFSAKKFYNIIGAMSEENGRMEQYFLLKDGTKFGYDSLYIKDMKFDCEHEGHIRFRDPYTYNTGLFDSTGRIVLVSDYNDLSQVHKGYLFAVKNAQKILTQNDFENQFIWVGGVVDLIKTDGTILVDSIYRYETLNLHSIQIHDSEPQTNEERRTFRGRDNKFYSFIDNKISFECFLKKLSKNIKENLHDDLIVWSEMEEWTDARASIFWKVNQKKMEEFVLFVTDTTQIYYLNVQNYIPYTEKTFSYFERYRDNCDNWNTMEYPIFEVSYPSEDDTLLSMYFLKMEDGFKIIAVRI